jgi:hypothetical protein
MRCRAVGIFAVGWDVLAALEVDRRSGLTLSIAAYPIGKSSQSLLHLGSGGFLSLLHLGIHGFFKFCAEFAEEFTNAI